MSAHLVLPGSRRRRRAPAPVDDGHGPQGRVLPSWPVDAMLWGFPLYWVLGLTLIAPIVLGLVMLAFLALSGRTRVVKGIGSFGLFLAWVVPCVLMIDSSDRLLGYLVRFATLAVVGVTLLYVANAPERLTIRRVLGGLSAVWVVVVVGGWLAVVAPGVSFTTPVGALLPDSLTNNDYVQDLFFPSFAEVQYPYGSPEPFNRPAAPFPYTNGWGAAVVLLTPAAVATFLATSSRRVRGLLVAALIALVVPAAASTNRGMLIGLAIAVVYVGFRLLGRGRVLPVAVLVAGAAVVLGGLVANGLFTTLTERQEYSDSAGGRASLYAETFERTLASPFLGYGAPRPSETLGVSVGTQGYVWMLMFSYGFVGLGLFLFFLWGTTLRTFAAPGLVRLCLHSVLVAGSVLVLYYGLDIMQLLAIALPAALLLRERRTPVAEREALP